MSPLGGGAECLVVIILSQKLPKVLYPVYDKAYLEAFIMSCVIPSQI